MTDTDPGTSDTEPGFLPAQPNRPGFESIAVRVIATAGVIGIATGVAALMGASNSAYWLTGLIVSTVSVILAAILWRSRRL